MENRLYSFIVLLTFLLLSCGSDGIKVEAILKGNVVLLSNNTQFTLAEVDDNNFNRRWLQENVVGEEVVLVNSSGDAIETNDEEDSSNGYLITTTGTKVNQTLLSQPDKAPTPDINRTPGARNLQELYKRNKEAVFIVYTSDGEKYHQGSGFLISPEGVGVSNYHVFAGTTKGKEMIRLPDGVQYGIESIMSSSKELDFIIFKLAAPPNTVFPFVSYTNQGVSVGESVFAIGNPKGLESTLSSGIVSSIRESQHLIQTTAEITNGSSGGPLFNMQGEVIGITSSGLGEANLNFAVDIRTLKLK